MRIAQQLYEGIALGKEGTVGLITYMRTDSTRISEVAQKDAREFIMTTFGEAFVPKETKNYTVKSIAKNAHEGRRAP